MSKPKTRRKKNFLKLNITEALYVYEALRKYKTTPEKLHNKIGSFVIKHSKLALEV